MAEPPVKIEVAEVEPEEVAKVEKSVKGTEQAPTVAQQTPTQSQWSAMRNVLGPPFDSERVTLYQMRQMRKDAMIAFGMHYIKVPLVRADWHIEARDKDGPNAQISAFVDAACGRSMPATSSSARSLWTSAFRRWSSASS